MKANAFCIGVLALAASLGAAAATPTETCIDALAKDPSLQVLADKVALARSGQAARVRIADRAPTEPERAALAAWMEKRSQCFDAGAAKRRVLSKPQEIAFLRSVFVFQQRLVADLQQGRLTYAEFNHRRAELAQAAGTEI
jgi:hypothetical protein